MQHSATCATQTPSTPTTSHTVRLGTCIASPLAPGPSTAAPATANTSRQLPRTPSTSIFLVIREPTTSSRSRWDGMTTNGMGESVRIKHWNTRLPGRVRGRGEVRARTRGSRRGKDWVFMDGVLGVDVRRTFRFGRYIGHVFWQQNQDSFHLDLLCLYTQPNVTALPLANLQTPSRKPLGRQRQATLILNPINK